ncbi:hypothetical protein NDU88_010835 [Pleurodeles waltl]|uniref:Uncharacterized protein n=1 Tax=Pleurodeles waltl TaxID=8319 RepID=A0AAV7QVH9_PLEWA|nr:hypothetical protein NDU88_010835 [Pleurodeles waltl]
MVAHDVGHGIQSGRLLVGAHARRRRRAGKNHAQHAQLALESEGTTLSPLKERALGGAANMAAPSGFSSVADFNEDSHLIVGREVGDDLICDEVIVVIDSDEELEKGNEFYREGCSKSLPASVSLPVQGGRSFQWIPRQVSPMVHRMQEWEVSNQLVLRSGERVEFLDEQGTVIKGTICGANMDDSTSGLAQVRLDFWQQGERPHPPGCEDAHVSGGHESAAAGQRLGRSAAFQRSVEVRAPSGHRVEERAQPGAARLTSREVAVREEGPSVSNVSGLRSLPASQGGLSGLACEEEALDYEDDDTNVRSVTVTKASSSKRAVQGDRLAGGKEVLSGNLIRGEVANAQGVVGAVSRNKGVVCDNLSNVDVAIQVEDVGAQAGKVKSLSGANDSTTGKYFWGYDPVEGELCQRLISGWAKEKGARMDRRRPITSQLLQDILGVLVKVVPSPDFTAWPALADRPPFVCCAPNGRGSCAGIPLAFKNMGGSAPIPPPAPPAVTRAGGLAPKGPGRRTLAATTRQAGVPDFPVRPFPMPIPLNCGARRPPLPRGGEHAASAAATPLAA